MRPASPQHAKCLSANELLQMEEIVGTMHEIPLGTRDLLVLILLMKLRLV